MYNNVGQKIKDIAIGMFLLEAIGSIVTGISLIAADNDFILIGLLVIFVGPFVAYCLSLFVYGFGSLVEKSEDATENVQSGSKGKKEGVKQSKKKKEIQAYIKSEPKVLKKDVTTYSVDGTLEDRDFVDFVCPNCGKEISYLKGQTEVTCPWCDVSLELR